MKEQPNNFAIIDVSSETKTTLKIKESFKNYFINIIKDNYTPESQKIMVTINKEIISLKNPNITNTHAIELLARIKEGERLREEIRYLKPKDTGVTFRDDNGRKQHLFTRIADSTRKKILILESGRKQLAKEIAVIRTNLLNNREDLKGFKPSLIKNINLQPRK